MRTTGMLRDGRRFAALFCSPTISPLQYHKEAQQMFEVSVLDVDATDLSQGATIASLEKLMDDVFERNVTKDITVSPTPAVKGMVVPKVHSNLSWLDCKGAFVTCQDGQHGDEGAETIDFDEFMVCLALCGQIKYEEIKEMTLVQRVSGIFANYLGEKDEHEVITEGVVQPIERFDPSTSEPLKDQPTEEHWRWLATWGEMDLSHVFGFPAWEKEVYGLLQGAFPELSSIFTYYAKSGSAGSASANAAETMQQTELVDLALDCDLPNEAFPMVRVQNIFERADQANGSSQGDNGLVLSEFLECVVMLAFGRANPKFGQVGHNTEASVPAPLHHRAKWRQEEALRASSLRCWSILRQPTYLENFGNDALAAKGTRLRLLHPGVVSGLLAPETELTVIAVDDLGQIALAIMEQGDAYHGRTLAAGAERISGRALAAAAGRVNPRVRFAYRPVPWAVLRFAIPVAYPRQLRRWLARGGDAEGAAADADAAVFAESRRLHRLPDP